MAKDAATFVAEDLWLFIAIVTFVLAGLAGMVGLGALAGPIAFLGWFFLTPLFLFWGEEIAAWMYGARDEATAMDGETAPADRARIPEDDPLERLKHRYAAGELTDAAFERQLERLIEVDERYERRDASGADDRDSASAEREYERERS